MNETYTIKDLLVILWNHLVLIIILTFLGGVAGYGFSKFMLPVLYSSHITMYVQSYTGITEIQNNVNNISNSKQLVNTYMEVLKDDEVMNAVSDKLMEQYNPAELTEHFVFDIDGKIAPSSLRGCLAISTVTDTSAVKIVATTRDPQLSADICNDLTMVAPRYVEEAVGVGSINTIGKAKLYPKPVAPSKTKNAIFGMIIAFVLVCTVVILVDVFDNTIKELDNIGSEYDIAIIGEIQRFDDGMKKKKKNKDQSENELFGLLTEKDVPFNIVESYKTIRANILFTAADSDKKIIAVSSPNPMEGKTTTAANIAVALAQISNSVLLLDADMRKPKQHRIFEVKNKVGLSTLIIKKSTPEESVQKTNVEHLDIITSGPVPPNPSELLASGTFKKCIEKFADEYDYIIIDTPPINLVSDAMVLKDCISGILLVVRYGATTFDSLALCMQQIDLAQINPLGLVLNDVQHNHNSTYYKKFYKYNYKKGGYGYYGIKRDTETGLEDLSPASESAGNTEPKDSETQTTEKTEPASAEKEAKTADKNPEVHELPEKHQPVAETAKTEPPAEQPEQTDDQPENSGTAEEQQPDAEAPRSDPPAEQPEQTDDQPENSGTTEEQQPVAEAPKPEPPAEQPEQTDNQPENSGTAE